jgi:hypothetical protein
MVVRLRVLHRHGGRLPLSPVSLPALRLIASRAMSLENIAIVVLIVVLVIAVLGFLRGR